MINGIPVIGSDRGALPETLGDGGIVLPLPERLTPVSQILPTAEEVEPWVEAIIRLWDDRAWYQEQSSQGAGTGPALASRPAPAAVCRVLRQGPSPARPPVSGPVEWTEALGVAVSATCAGRRIVSSSARSRQRSQIPPRGG